MGYAGVVAMENNENLAREIVEDINALRVFHIDEKTELKLILSTGIVAFAYKYLERIKHARGFQALLDGYVKSGRYPVAMKLVMEGKEGINESDIHHFSESVDKSHFLKQFVSFALFKKLYIVKNLSKSNAVDEFELEEMKAAIAFFDMVLSDLKEHADEKTRGVINHALNMGTQIMSLIHSKKTKRSNHLKPLYSAVSMFFVAYLLAFSFIDLDATYNALLSFVMFDY